MELFILLISVPVFLVIVLLFSLYILPKYSGRVPEEEADTD